MIANGLIWVARALLVMASILALVLSFIVVVDVVGRSVFNQPLRGTVEIVSSSIVIIAYMQVTYAIVSGGMMRVTLVSDAMPPRLRGITGAITSAFGILLFWVVFRGAIDGFSDAWRFGSFEGEGALRVPTWPVWFAVMGGSCLAGIAYILLTFENLRMAVTGREPETALSLR